jgi:threonine aldolase
MLAAVNGEHARAYGEDRYSEQVRGWFRDQFGGDAESFLVWNGTGANVVALRAMTRPWQAIVCAEQSHVGVDECGAAELLTGCKVISLPSPDAKLTVDQLRSAVRRVGDEHASQLRVVSIAQPTEYGTVYSRDEMAAICETAHGLGLLVFVDGARISNAAASLGLSFREFTRDVGVDMLSFGATKIGAMGAEAIVVFDTAAAAEMKYLRKQSTQLPSKARYVAAQFLALAENDLWLANARNANAMARRLYDGVRGVEGIHVTQPVQASAVFATLAPERIKRLQQEFHFYVWDERIDEVRWMTNWATAADDVDELIGAVRASV